MASESSSDGLPAHVRLLLLVLAVAVVGVVLYELFPFLPGAVQVFVMLAACVIAMRGSSTAGEKTLAALLVAYLAVLVRICVYGVIVWESIRPGITREDAEFRVWFVVSCLVAVLRVLDGRVSFRE